MRREARKEARGKVESGALLRRGEGSPQFYIVAWCGFIESVPAWIELLLPVLLFFSAVFSAVFFKFGYYNSLYFRSYSYYTGFSIINYFYYSDSRPKCLSSALSSTSSISLIIKRTYSTEKPGIVISLLLRDIATSLLKGLFSG